jgi:hypothetical protein
MLSLPQQMFSSVNEQAVLDHNSHLLRLHARSPNLFLKTALLCHKNGS